MAGTQRVRELVGVPVLPPPRATAVSDRLRSVLAGLHRRSAPPPVQVLEGLFGLMDHAALGALCHMGVPDSLDGPVALADLVAAAGRHGNGPDGDGVDGTGPGPDTAERIVRYAVGRGWLRLDRRGRVHPTGTSRFLRRDHPGGWRAWVEFACTPEVVAAVSRLATDPGTPDPFDAAHGQPFFEYCRTHPRFHARFDAAMDAGGRMHGLVLAGALDWADDEVVCDVGGGTGALLAELVSGQPHLRGMVLDLPEVVARGEAHPRVGLVAGDAFTEVPAGASTYLLVNVVHDWDDDDAVRLLSVAAAALAPAARVVVVEGERRPVPVDGIALRTDLLMLALTPGGRERTTAEIEALGTRAGLRPAGCIPLATGDRAHVFRTG